MKIYVNKMPKKKEDCFFYRNIKPVSPLLKDTNVCSLTSKECSLKNEDSLFGAECRCLKVCLSK